MYLFDFVAPTGHSVCVFFYKIFVCRPLTLFSDDLLFFIWIQLLFFWTPLNDTISMINFDGCDAEWSLLVSNESQMQIAQ